MTCLKLLFDQLKILFQFLQCCKHNFIHSISMMAFKFQFLTKLSLQHDVSRERGHLTKQQKPNQISFSPQFGSLFFCHLFPQSELLVSLSFDQMLLA
mmetsp:Transcript_37826/g.52528  ORF Transcript_37826/g.52528 Transcript_37826/m.52528 type:complete len:97 (-) Transcript_37826:759-1049(-)